MATNIYLTDDDSDIAGYKRAIIGTPSDLPSLVQAITNTVTAPATQPQITRTANGTIIQWITDPLKAGSFSAASWTFHVWALENNVAAKTGLEFKVGLFTSASQAPFLDDSTGPVLTTTIQDYSRATGNATLTSFNDGTRLYIQVFLTSVGGSVSGYTVQFDYNGLYPFADGSSYVICPDSISVLADVPASSITSIRQYLKDSDPSSPALSDEEVANALNGAVNEYSQDRPRRLVVAQTGDGSTFDFPLPRYWAPNISEIVEIEFPANPTQQSQVRRVILNKDYEIIMKPVGVQPVWNIRWLTLTPDATPNNIYVRYTAQHIHNTVFNSITSDDLPSVLQLAASYAAGAIAGKYAQTADSSFAADAINYRDLSARWLKISDYWRDQYANGMGLGEDLPPTGHQVDWDTSFSWLQDRLIHRRRWR